MAIVSIGPVGQTGLVADKRPYELPLDAWSSGENVHFPEGRAEKVSGYQAVFGTPLGAPYFATLVRNPAGNYFWIYAGATGVWVYNGSVHTDITRTTSAYTTSGALGWHGGMLNGVPVLNNGVDAPQSWSSVGITTKLVDLPNWPVGATAKILRTYKNSLVALGITKAGILDPRLVKWSHPASAGAVPSSWDETDTTKDAGEYSLADTDGALVDCVTLRDTNIVYKDDSIWAMNYVGGLAIFKFSNLFRNVGALGKNCAVEFQTGKHLVLSRDDLFVHDGQTITSIARGRIRNWLFGAISSDGAFNSFLALDAPNAEVWVCFPEAGNLYPNKALIWNWVTGAFGMRTLPSITSLAAGVLNPGSTVDQWGGDAELWNGSTEAWGSLSYNPLLARLLMCAPAETKLYAVLPTNTSFDGVAFTSSLERTGLGIPFDTSSAPDITSMKFCSRIWPMLSGPVGGVVQVQFGGQMDINEEPLWGAWQDFTVGVTKKIDVLASGRMFGLRIRSTTDVSWVLQSFSLDVRKIGAF